MGTGHSSHNNLRSDCTSFDVTHDGAKARWRNSLEVSMGNWRKGNTEFWGVEYKTNQKKREKCSHFEFWGVEYDDVGLYVVAKIRHNMGHGFVVEVDGPFKRSVVYLDEVISLTFHTGVWSPNAFSHSNGANRSHGEETRGQIVNTFLQKNNGEQYNTVFSIQVDALLVI